MNADSITLHRLELHIEPKSARPAFRKIAALYEPAVEYRVQTHGRHASTVVVETGDYGYAADLADAAASAGATSIRWTTEVRTPSETNPDAYYIRQTRDERIR